jgi:very-short-patch-repair endonuclease
MFRFNPLFVCEYIFKTKEFNINKVYPTHYKIDIALEGLMVAIEIDGSSHNSKKK